MSTLQKVVNLKTQTLQSFTVPPMICHMTSKVFNNKYTECTSYLSDIKTVTGLHMIQCKTKREKLLNTKVAGNLYSLVTNSRDFLVKNFAMIRHVILQV